MIKKELNQRGIQYNEKQVKSELVTILRSNIQSETQNRIEEAQQAANKSNSIEPSSDKENQQEIRSEYFHIGWALKETQKYGKRGGRKHMTVRIIKLLKSFFHAGDVDKSERYTAKDMLNALEKKTEVGELETSEIPKLKTIENWIGCYARQYKKDLGKKAQNLSFETLHES
ncbi:hypothetical protein C2G38_2047279 [Gigaspora rosea]|uniref:Uncharacterized protein n=1 Tax=Gigaspora rosea TaxID=44941 RepID=A0A397U9V5_9GLOM|nr:hypothetical protein C2G38_2047279 [Gigaspora rosea]